MDKDKDRLEPTQGHHARPSIDTNASGIESTISFSAFPLPPPSIPTTPIAVTPNDSPLRAEFAHSPHRIHLNRPFARPSAPPSPVSRTISPHDWHEGASSIDVDATEDRLLSTSFITSLLQESSDSSPSSRRASVTTSASDALSGFSEMTYPPPNRTVERPPVPPLPSISRVLPNRPNGARPPPSSFPTSRPFPTIPESPSPGHLSDAEDSDTLYSAGHDDLTIIKSASITRGPRMQGASVVGMAPARLHSITSNNWRPSTIASSELADGDKSGYAEYNEVANNLPYSPALPSTAIHSGFFHGDKHGDKQSVRSAKSFAPSVISRISSAARSITRNLPLPWKQNKPLPPVPIIPTISVAAEREYQREEASVPLPDLVERAGVLNGMLEKGYHPHHSLSSYHKHSRVASGCDSSDYKDLDTLQRRRDTRSSGAPWSNLPDSPTKSRGSRISNRKRYLIILAVFIVIAAAAIGAGVGVSLSRRSSNSLPACSSSNLTGRSCDLDATCVCTSTQCIAQSIVDLIPTMNDLFSTDLSIGSVYNSLWFAVGSPSGGNCASQALLIDVGPALSTTMHSNRTTWARVALLWNIVQSQDSSATQSLQEFIRDAPWSDIDGSDGPVDDQKSSFSTSASGFIFDFASQTVTQQSVSFVDNGQPLSDQISRVGDTARQALDRMYSFARASSTQQQTALSTYWTSVLQQRTSDLSAFRSAIISSPILLSFDATFDGVSDIMTNSSSEPFPPPLACYPDLNSTLSNNLDSVEQTVFGLEELSEASKFDTSCYPDRPIYGVLDVLRLRLPFADSEGVPKQAAVLHRTVGPRAVLRSGELLSTSPDSFNASAFTPSSLNPRNYGTLNNLNHVLLSYLTSIPDVNVAKELVTFLLSSSDSPPSNDSTLGQAISSIPPLEVAVFGSVIPEDIDSALSSFSTPNGSLFFGSEAGQALREWAITGAGSHVTWAETALSTAVAQDSSFSDDTFNNIWNNASAAIRLNVTNVGVGNITTALQVSGKLSS